MPCTCHHCHQGSCRTQRHTATTESDDTPSSSTLTMSSTTTRMGLDPGFFSKPKEKGSVFNVAIARSYNGTDAGDVCVAKWVRRSHDATCGEDHVKAISNIVRIAEFTIRDFLNSRDTADWIITINRPHLMRCQSEGKYAGKVVLVEPYISDFKKFNSNTGWVRPSKRTYNKVLQALSHYSYVFSLGNYILCDLQGGVVEEEKHIKLTDAAIVSKDGKGFGCGDIGKRGISNFFHFHKCNELCEDLPSPKKNKVFFTPVEMTKTSHK